jgi:microcystin-dependent protein
MPEIVGRLRPPRLSTPPASPAVGEMYYDVDDNVLYFWDGTTWVSTKSAAGTIYDSDQIGTIKSFTGTVIPTNWMLADGRTLNRVDYPQLADAMGISAGATTFALPDLRNKFIYGASAPSGSPWSGGGAATHALTAAESGMPSHYHNSISVYANRNFVGVGNLGGNEASNQGDYGPYAIQHVAAAGPLNASSAHNNMPPYILLAQIIKVMGAQIDAGGALVGPPGRDGVDGVDGEGAPVYEQSAAPTEPVEVGALWIDPDDVPPPWMSYVPLVSTLPSGPVDGQEIYYQSSALAALGIVWHLRYRAAISDAYKWEFVGGAYVRVTVDAESTTTTVGQWLDLGTPTFTLPLAGVYQARSRGAMRHSVANGVIWWSMFVGSSQTGGFSYQHPIANGWITVIADQAATCTVGQTVKTQVHNSTAGTLGVAQRTIEITPVRVG